MRIQKITYPLRFTQPNKSKEQSNTTKQNSYSYNPIAYQDYNISFGARLFRTPEEFYSCDFNKNGMPETMKQYLNADYEDRQHMPPQQMLKLVFDDINEDRGSKTLEHIKRNFPDEPLFKNLTDTPNRKSKTGILAEIDLMKDEGKTLFKNGKDNLGHYILKKIYLEGKTLKEINEDFNKDKSVYYKGLSPIEYETARAYGIRFPNQAFWNSFVHNRKNYNYVYKPRKPIEQRNVPTDVTKAQQTTQPQKKRFGKVKEWEIDRLADALNKGNGNVEETKKHLRKSSVNDEASLNFVAKYMGEINSVVLEKLHVSPEMREFFENPELLSKNQKQKMEAYWQNSERRELRSTTMKDTIKLFFDAYGVDGQNEEFRDLIDYARNIKPNRLAQLEEHNKLQAEYDEMFANIDALEMVKNNIEAVKDKSVDEILADTTKKYDVNEYRFKTDKGDVVILSNLHESIQEYFTAELSFMPKAISNKFIRFVADKDIPESYTLSKLLQKSDINLPEDDRLMSQYDVDKTTIHLYQDFEQANKISCRAGQQAVMDAFAKYEPNPKLMTVSLFEFIPIMNSLEERGRNLIRNQREFINARYNEYKKPLSDSETHKITLQLFDLLKNYNPRTSVITGKDRYEDFNTVLYSVKCYLKNQNPSDLKNSITKYVKEYGGSSRILLDKNTTKEIKSAKMQQIMLDYACDRNAEFSSFVLKDPEGRNYIKFNSPELYKNNFGI